MNRIDALGTAHQPDPAARIVSLVPSVTELLCTLGLAQQIVGRTGFCIHPAQTVGSIAKVGGTKDVNLGKIRRLAPSHVVLNIDENTKAVADALAQFVPNIIVTHPNTPRDNLALARLMGGVFCREREAEDWCSAFEAELARLQTAPRAPGRTMLYCIWRDPWMSVSRDTYIAAMLAEIGWSVPALPVGGELVRYPRFDWSEALLGQIDGVLLSTEPYSFTEADAAALQKQIGKPVWLVDGEMLSWYGSRALAGLRYLGELRVLLEGAGTA